jgi:hypothetical protein
VAPAGSPHDQEGDDVETKDLRDLRRITPAEAYRLASPTQRQAWFPDGPPSVEVKAGGPYSLPAAQPAGPSHLTPYLEGQLANYRQDHARGQCPQHKSAAPDETWDGDCACNRGTPAARAEQRRWQQRTRLTTLLQQARAGQLGNPVRVVTVGQATQEDAMRAGFHAMVDELFG